MVISQSEAATLNSIGCPKGRSRSQKSAHHSEIINSTAELNVRSAPCLFTVQSLNESFEDFSLKIFSEE